MNVISAYYDIMDTVDGNAILKRLELYGRTCYKSELNVTNESATKFIKSIIDSGHESVIEHEKVTVKIICDRGISHELVRHRIASYSQESTRYCNYANDRFNNELTFIRPYFWDEKSEQYSEWLRIVGEIEKTYFKLLSCGAKPEEARSILPNSLKTEVVVTMNLREWRHFFKLRTTAKAHPQMREIAIPLLLEMKKVIPVIFDDINI